MEHGRQLRPAFTAQVEAAAASLDTAVSWLSEHWVASLRRGPFRAAIVGYSFPLNNASAAHLATDKVAAYEVLRSERVPAVEHKLVRFNWQQSRSRPSAFSPRGWTVAADLRPRLVLKPHADGGGVDVVRASTTEEMQAHIASVSVRYRAITVSRYVDIQAEYRIVVLDGDVLLAFRKRRRRAADGVMEWRHNLRFGAIPEVIDVSDLNDVPRSLARAAMTALGLRFASVDVVVAAGAWQVLEINSGVALEHFSAHSPEAFDMARRVYSLAIERVVM